MSYKIACAAKTTLILDHLFSILHTLLHHSVFQQRRK